MLRTNKQLNETYSYIARNTNNFNAEIGIILGTGLGGLVNDISIQHKIKYSKIPYFPVSTVESHHGNLILGTISGKNAVVMQGRFHYYEKYSHEEITYPVRLMKSMGIKVLIVSNACGGLNPGYKKADLMIMRDHINFHFDTPLKNFKHPSNKLLYSDELICLAEKAALQNGISIKKGVYLSLHGPALETKSEYRMVRKFGADVVGMSTIPEVTAAAYLGIKTLGLSIITDIGLPDTLKPAVLEEILAAAAEAEPKMTLLTNKTIEMLSFN
ncbi:MAG: purine-nucleoside phosphorylase [Ignavibacteria bacterium]|nr:purine-nucleoside phosphorylase [Ignavibacteria bacterium]